MPEKQLNCDEDAELAHDGAIRVALPSSPNPARYRFISKGCVEAGVSKSEAAVNSCRLASRKRSSLADARKNAPQLAAPLIMQAPD
jgi:hypothetical protein